MENNNKVISIRLIYVILFIAVVIGIVVGIKNSKQNDGNQALYAEEETSTNNLEIARTANEDTTSRSEDLSRNSEENGENIISEEENNVNENSEENGQNESSEENENNLSTESEDEVSSKSTEKENNESENPEELVEETKYISISEVKISKSMDLTQRTGLSREDFITLIAGVKQDTSGFFEENAGLIYDLCEEYSLNEIFFCGIISAESGWNIASNHRSTHNYISLMSNGKLNNFASVESGLREAARVLHTNYLTPGGKFYYGKTLSAVKTKFCPASSTWVDLVYGRMSQII